MTWGGFKRCFSFIVFMVITTGSAHGFVGAQQDPGLQSILNNMDSALKLTKAQEKEVAFVLRDYAQKVDDLKAGGSAGIIQEDKMKALREQMDSDLSHYLSDEQMALWKHVGSQVKAPANTASAGNDRVLNAVKEGLKKDAGAGQPGPQNDNGVLESSAPDKIKTSGIW